MDHLLTIRSARRSLDRAFDAGLAATVVGWSIALVRAGDRPLGVAIGLVSVNLVVALSFLRRTAPIDEGSLRTMAWALPSVVASGFAYRVATAEWPIALVALHDACALFVIGSLVALGRSFAILPSRRALVSGGPYALVRNPIYLGETGMLVTAAATRGALYAVLAAAIAIALLVPRILAEERLLAADPAYEAYRARVRFRLLPGLF